LQLLTKREAPSAPADEASLKVRKLYLHPSAQRRTALPIIVMLRTTMTTMTRRFISFMFKLSLLKNEKALAAFAARALISGLL